jgi:hypothetical protein
MGNWELKIGIEQELSAFFNSLNMQSFNLKSKI